MFQRPDLTDMIPLPGVGGRHVIAVYECGNHVIKTIPKSRGARILEVVLEGTRRLQDAGVPVLPIIDHWETPTHWYYVQAKAQTDSIDWYAYGISRVLSEIVYPAYDVGVPDLLPDNVCLYQGQAYVLDAGAELSGDSDMDQIMLAETIWDWEKFNPDF